MHAHVSEHFAAGDAIQNRAGDTLGWMVSCQPNLGPGTLTQVCGLALRTRSLSLCTVSGDFNRAYRADRRRIQLLFSGRMHTAQP